MDLTLSINSVVSIAAYCVCENCVGK